MCGAESQRGIGATVNGAAAGRRAETEVLHGHGRAFQTGKWSLVDCGI